MRLTAISVLAVCALVVVGGCGSKRAATAGDAESPKAVPTAKSAGKGAAATPATPTAPAAQAAPAAKAEPVTAAQAAPKSVAADTPPKPAEPATAAAVNTICPVTGDLIDPRVPPVVVEITVVRPPLIVSIATSSARAAEIVRANPERYAPAALDNRKATSSLNQRLSQ